MASAFLSPGILTREGQLTSLHIRRDQSLPVILSTQVLSADDDGYAEGVVTNTRFGSFPHSTLIGVPWGSQIRASKVDTGSRGRTGGGNKRKRKADALKEANELAGQNGDGGTPKEAVEASSGFIHVLPPTPENWTTSLPHRTQVVYTPDYSYVLHRIRARPGSKLIEAGSGSGSFTHAAIRAVFNGHPGSATRTESGEKSTPTPSFGKVFTYEFHAERQKKLAIEMEEHGLQDLVHSTHRDVYQDGFLVHDDTNSTKTSPQANAVFLDLPSPWEALPHLTRAPIDGSPSALDPSSTVHICTFSPCIEQAQKTISSLRQHGWLDIEMVEIQHKRIDIRRDYTGLQYEGIRGANQVAADVDEALARLREVEGRSKQFHAGKLDNGKGAQQGPDARLPFNQGRLIHRSEPELKTHTSYLVFALLPRTWTEEDELEAQAKWSKHVKIKSNVPKSQRQLKKESKQRRKGQNGVEGMDGSVEQAREQDHAEDAGRANGG